MDNTIETDDQLDDETDQVEGPFISPLHLYVMD
jgi:hypothetical protein